MLGWKYIRSKIPNTKQYVMEIIALKHNENSTLLRQNNVFTFTCSRALILPKI